MPSLVRVTNLDNGRSLIVRVNDRGPYKRGRVMDVSARAAELLGFKNIGTAKVKLQLLQEESQKIAMAAKSGQDTSGYELAMNQQPNMYNGRPQQVANVVTGGVPYQTAAANGYSTSVQTYPLAPQGAPVPQVVTAYAPDNYTAIVPGHERNGNFYPDPVVTEMPVRPSNIYVQAGSFSVADNANRLAASLRGLGNGAEVRPALVAGRQFYRVRLGPVRSVEQADALLSRVVSAGGKNAIIVVE
jgi:rare lipoprotein A